MSSSGAFRVNFLIAGTQKGGTTALAEFLSKHPEIGMATVKEVHFFDRNRTFRGGSVDYEKYHRFFPRSEKRRIFGEATPIYLYWKPAMKRISEYNPAMKLVFILRDPAERAYSHWVMETKRGAETLAFSRAIRLEKLRCLASFPRQHRIHSYVDRGFYSKQIERAMRFFPREQLLFLKNEDLKGHHRETMDRVCDFLGVTRLGGSEHSIIFSNEYEAMAESDRQYLNRRFAKEIERLEKLLGWDCSAWKRKS